MYPVFVTYQVCVCVCVGVCVCVSRISSKWTKAECLGFPLEQTIMSEENKSYSFANWQGLANSLEIAMAMGECY